MKIIGRTKEGYIIDASTDEIANLVGYYGKYSLDKKVQLSIGDQINISQMYKQLYNLSRKHEEIKNAKEKLAECIKYMDEIEPVIDVKID